jgi:adenylate kinase family enzyme
MTSPPPRAPRDPRSWQRISVVGVAGAGKTSLSVLLAQRLGLPVVHLDVHFWQPGWVASEPQQWETTVAGLVARPRWVMDGNYAGTFGQRFAASDAVVFLDVPRSTAMTGVLRRWWTLRGQQRPDVGPGCPETIDREFLRWVWRYRDDARPVVLEALAAVRDRTTVVHHGSRDETRAWLASLPVAGTWHHPRRTDASSS